jgi:aryl carrier-like protein
LLARLPPSATVGDLRAQLVSSAQAGVDPEDILSLAEELCYEASVGWSPRPAEGEYDLLLELRAPGRPSIWPAVQTMRTSADRNWAAYVNDPLTAVSAERLAPMLRSFLKEKLPDHMIPSAFVPLARLPVTANGKVDRAALPHPELREMRVGVAGVAPQSELERALATIWQDLLGLDRVAVDDNFFDLGGHSLLMIRLQARLKEALSADVSMMDLFKHPTIRSLATRINSGPTASPAARREIGREDSSHDEMLRRVASAGEQESTAETQVAHGQAV